MSSISPGGQPSPFAGHLDAIVEEYGYGIGPPTGMVVLRYRRAEGLSVADTRDDHLHWLYVSPDGVLCVRRAGATTYLAPGTGFWATRGHVHQIASLSAAGVLRVGLREAPPALSDLGAGPVEVPASVLSALLDVTRPNVSEEAGLAARAVLMAGVRDSGAVVPPQEPGTGLGAGYARRVAAALSADPADDTTLQEWADRLHISAKTLQRDFTREFATSYTEWRSRLRLQAARALLRTLPVSETAHRVGYASPSAFVGAFTRQYGETPGQWARR
ncbi:MULTISPECIES: helix-turn-helix domain-containing protein [unclassified Nocardioides]|uniref:helix-turn-helix domain-containing protein n=1 Tax=unclassified Nocardioides TaxID=2615069 RepID=UPI001E4CD2A3|nr:MULTISPECIES: AraC family transcriptional regulator [unclassified Nocardioides]